MIGVAVLILYGLGATGLFLGASDHASYFLQVEKCDQHKLIGLTENGKSITLYFPRWFGSGQSSWGDGATVKTVDQDKNWNSSRPIEICNSVLGIEAGFDTNGLHRIELVKFLEE
ncbi:MAG: hypothetical protein UW63_C0040G0004 [Candidatus Uhrbacteria bacterium GW2011_GWF2_44_350]|nr:MAG: hypothetical protein UW63_C0040G0004 [Candidatus Uhrbacteria bacterium GW2011_GWF2_44_350]